jgi:hypothetical protein
MRSSGQSVSTAVRQARFAFMDGIANHSRHADCRVATTATVAEAALDASAAAPTRDAKVSLVWMSGSGLLGSRQLESDAGGDHGCGGGVPGATSRAAVDDAEQRADGRRLARLQPRLELFEAPVVHADLAAAATLAATHKHRPTPRVEVNLRQIERLLDSQTGAPEHDDQRAPARRARRRDKSA